ncbi:MAG: PAS domain S-box protein, partial [Oscillospiraceae bacterium]|nr:PAS domain S-box protein [Oscillospiraceae bacterium]
MYHCHITFYLLGRRQDLFEALKGMPPLERFTHTFLESERLDMGLLAQADVVFADMRDIDAGGLLALAGGRKPGADLILLANRDEIPTLAEAAAEVKDIWSVPMSTQEVQFRFLRWQQGCRLEKDRWQAEQLLDASIEGTPNLIWYKNRDGAHVKANSSFLKMVRKTRDQVIGQTHAYVWDTQEDEPASTELEAEVMRTRETRTSDEVIRTHSGEVLLNTYKSPLFDLDGSVMGTVGVAINKTRERSYARESIEKGRMLELLFSTMDYGVMCHSMDGLRIISINEAALRLLGYGSKEELLRDGFNVVAPSVLESDKQRLRECITALKAPGESISIEYRVRHKDGKLLHILGTVKLVEEGGELLYQRFLVDYTAQKQREEEKSAEKDLEIEYQEQLLSIFSTFLSDNVDDVYIMMDASGYKVEFVSPNVERVLGVPVQALLDDTRAIGRAEYITGHDVDGTELASLEPGMSLEPMETKRIHQKTMEEKWFRESVSCVSVQGVKKIIIYISDRTKERRSQNALSEALEMAQVANKAKSAFLGNVSHDIRTPMNAIMGFVALLKEEADQPDRVREYTQKISAASQHLLG